MEYEVEYNFFFKKKVEYKKWVALGNHNIVLFTVTNIRVHTKLNLYHIGYCKI